MAKTIIILLFCTLISGNSFSQTASIDSLTQLLTIAKDDSSRSLIMSQLSSEYISVNIDSAIAIARKAIELSRRINFPKGEVRGLISMAIASDSKGDLSEALELNFQSSIIAEKHNLVYEKSMSLVNIGNVFWDLDDYPRAISSFKEAMLITKQIPTNAEIASLQNTIEESLGAVFMLNNQLDSAFAYLQKIFNETPDNGGDRPTLLMFFGDLQFRMGKRMEGLNYLRQSIDRFQKNKNHYSLSDACRFISECFRQMNMIDSSIFYAKKGLAEAQSIGYTSPILYNSKMLAELYEPKDIRKALYYRKIYDTINEVYYGPSKVKRLQKALSDEQKRQRSLEAASITYRNRLKQYALLAMSAIILLIAFILFRNNQKEKKANTILEHQKEKIENTLGELRSTQAQLIQSEKMASLGELTSGIAHEIQNPLNFVNNFSEVNKEMLEELKIERLKPKAERDDHLQDELINDVIENSEKINHHGKRADAIVKGMLQHSRKSSGQKEPTDINALADEYLRLSYHGLRAKDKNFNATMKTDFDPSIEKINIIPQDIGRVLLNLFNNAFYVVSEKQKAELEKLNAETHYEPTVSVSTKKLEGKIEIHVKDNGSGIPQNIVDKIFQPFFTTKPTGEGTGLGLSLSYDIIKAHGGELEMRTRENEFTEFVIFLPDKTNSVRATVNK